MNTYFNLSFLNIYEFFFIKKILLRQQLKNNFKFFNNKQFQLLLINYKTFGQNLFRTIYAKNKTSKVKKKKLTIKFSSSKNYYFNKNLVTFFKNKNIKLIKNNFFFFYLFSNLSPLNNIFHTFFFNLFLNIKKTSLKFLTIYKQTIGEGFFYIRGLFLIFFMDACLTDDEPL
jgi:hypothetical protein